MRCLLRCISYHHAGWPEGSRWTASFQGCTSRSLGSPGPRAADSQGRRTRSLCVVFRFQSIGLPLGTTQETQACTHIVGTSFKAALGSNLLYLVQKWIRKRLAYISKRCWGWSTWLCLFMLVLQWWCRPRKTDTCFFRGVSFEAELMYNWDK